MNITAEEKQYLIARLYQARSLIDFLSSFQYSTEAVDNILKNSEAINDAIEFIRSTI